MKKNKDQKNEEKLNKKNITSQPENLSDSVDNSLDEIKKLADDFSMSDEPIFDDEVSNQPREDDLITNSEDFLERLGDIAGNTAPELDQRLEAISSEKEQKMVEPFSPKEQATPENDDYDQNQDLLETSESMEEKGVEDLFIEDESNEVFLDRLKTSLDNDPDYKELLNKSSDDLDSFKTYKEGIDDSEIIEDLEQEIVNADKATNPFLTNADEIGQDDFITNLENIPVDEYSDQPKEKSSQVSPLQEETVNLSSDSWEDLIESTGDDENQDIFNFEGVDSFDDFLKKMDDVDIEEEDIQPFSLPESTERERDSQSQSLQIEDPISEEDALLENPEESEESVDNLRKSFIDEFDQTAWEAELAKQNEKKWLPKTLENTSNWFKALNPGEKILIILSFLISLAVIVAIGLVLTQWSLNRKVANPPPAIEMADADLIYPTGIELPGGWFFFLQRGEIQENRWEPVNAEWLANTKLRRVVAIPWSNQSEEVIQSLTTEDEISLFMNNNDTVIYQVEEVLQISRENVRILSDTEPSLVVILFREDDADRWAVIAKPK